MKILFIEKKAMELRYERACLLVYEDGKRITSVPVKQLDRIVVAPHIVLAAGVLGLIAEHNVSLLVLNSRYPERCACLSGAIPGDIHRRVAQIKLLEETAFRLEWSKKLVYLKISGQHHVLALALKTRPELRYPLFTAQQRLKQALVSIKEQGKVESLQSLRGVEGAASAGYFAAFTLLFAESLHFYNRNRRPPKDPVNVCLSLAYTLFHHEAINALKIVGLDPAVGCYHELYYHRESLACDLLEPVRPMIDSWLWSLFRNRLLRPEDFVINPDSCIFNSAGKQRFYEAFYGKVDSIRLLLRRYARIAAHTVEEFSHEQPY
jgi:CRISPR-associated protein Cas1